MSVLDRNNVIVNGTGPQAMVFAHGFGCDQTMWRFVEPEFRRDFTTVLYDLTGCGKSDLSQYDFKKYASLQGHADDLLEILDELDLKGITFVGHSVSAMTGLLASIGQPGRFRGMIMVGPTPRYINDRDYVGGFAADQIESLLNTLDLNYLGWSRSMAQAVMGNPARPELGEELTNAFCSNDPKIAGHFARVTFYGDHRKDLPRCHTPCLILQCSEDLIAPPEVGQYLHCHLAGSRLVILKATGHCPNLSAPEETIGCMRTWLEQS